MTALPRISIGYGVVTFAGKESVAPYRLGPVAVDAGVHEVAAAFTNDAWDPPEDRNLVVRKLVLR